MEQDEELKRIREEKLRRLMKKTAKSKEERSAEGKPVELTEAGFRKMIQNHPLVVVDCWAPWCAPCRMIAPIIEELAQKYAGRISFGKLNVDENGSAAVEYQIMSIPTLLVFKNGELVDRIVGAMPMGALEQRITRHL